MMVEVLSTFGLVIAFVGYICSALDPCTSPMLIGDNEYRGTQCFGKSPLICDRGMFTSGWYYSKTAGEYKSMPETCPAQLTCGTMTPIWLKGKHPIPTEGVVNRLACIRGHLDDDCCHENITIELKNCGDFYVYNLPETQSCHVAYCFGNDTCPVPSTTTTSPSAQMEKRETMNVVYYVIIGVLMFLILVALVVIGLILHNKKNVHGSKVDVKHSPVVVFDVPDSKQMVSHPKASSPPPYTERF